MPVRGNALAATARPRPGFSLIVRFESDNFRSFLVIQFVRYISAGVRFPSDEWGRSWQ